MKVAHVIDNLGAGGAQKLLAVFAEQAVHRGVQVVAVGLKPSSETRYIEELKRAGVEVHVLPACNQFRRFLRVVKLLRDAKPDVVHTHLRQGHILGLIAAGLVSRPSVATLHNVDVEARNLKRAMMKWLETWVLRHRAAQVIGVGDIVADSQGKRLGRGTVYVVRNPVSPIDMVITPEERVAIRSSLLGKASSPLLLAVGRLAEQKAYHHLLEAVALLRHSVPAVTLAVAGEGHLRQPLESRIQELGLEENVVLLGPRSDVPRLMRAADVFVSSSLWEGLPLVLLEAMDAGLAIVATEVGDVPTVVGNAGVLVPPADPQQMADALALLLSDPARLASLGREARDHVREQNDPVSWLEELMGIYGEQIRRASRK